MVRRRVRRIEEEVTELFAHPGGWAARPMVHVLNFFNGRGNRLVPATLEIEVRHRVLEVGFGGGAAIRATLATLEDQGALCGVDLSPDMARLAADRFRTTAGGAGLVFACGDAEALPLRSEAFDRAYAMHSHLYWPSPLVGIREIHRVLRPHGRILLGMDVVAGVRLVRRFGRDYEPAGPDRLAELLSAAGFTTIKTKRLTAGVVAVLGTRP